MKWTKEELNYLKNNYSKNVSLLDISKQMNRTIESIQHKATRLNISRPRFHLNKSTNKQPKSIIDKRYYEKNKEKVYRRKMERRKRLKREILKMLGGKCSKCGYNKCENALDFHHKEDKEGTINRLLKNESREKILKEAKKCILLCANCHREVHQGSVV
jgi:predicted HNH restriction endonuclease